MISAHHGPIMPVVVTVTASGIYVYIYLCMLCVVCMYVFYMFIMTAKCQEDWACIGPSSLTFSYLDKKLPLIALYLSHCE